jgi:hypothetical protein
MPGSRVRVPPRLLSSQAGHWRQLESFISERSPAQFSHTVCDACARTHYAGLLD